MFATILTVSLVLLFYFNNLKKYNILKKHLFDLDCQLKDYKAKYNNISVEFSNLNSEHLDLIKSTTNQIADLNLNLLNSQNDFKSLEKSLHSLRQEHQKELKEQVKLARQDTIKRSRSVLRGQASEHLAPFVIKGTNPKDYRFIGNPIDYICFDGLSDIIDKTSEEIKAIKLIDIKTGKSSLTKTQRKIRDAIKENKITFEVINLDKELFDDKT